MNWWRVTVKMKRQHGDNTKSLLFTTSNTHRMVGQINQAPHLWHSITAVELPLTSLPCVLVSASKNEEKEDTDRKRVNRREK